MNKDVVIVSAVRTPIGSFLGSLSTIPAPKLGATAIKAALEKINLKPELVEEVLMGNVVQAGTGQAPARQAAIHAGIPDSVPCTTINKVCASGMKAVMQAAQAIQLGDADIVVAGGMENMSLIPHYYHARTATKFGPATFEDGMQKDGLVDAYDNNAMGVCADACATEYKFSREDQDAFAVQSYERSKAAWDSGKFDNEVIPVDVPQRRGDAITVDRDQEYTNVKMEKISALRPAFTKDGTVTAANASTINDGASAIILASAAKVKELGLTPVAKIVSFADAAQEPEWFTTAPTLAAPIALKRAGMTWNDVDFMEVNEAFAVVPMAFAKNLNLDASKMNVFGGSVAIGHPLGASGARILTTLNNVLHKKSGSVGMAAICNGGGGASALIIEKV